MASFPFFANSAIQSFHQHVYQLFSPPVASVVLFSFYAGFAYLVWSKILGPPIRKLFWKPPNLKGKIALVTGASRGIGKGIALGLAEAGCTVYITGRSMGTTNQFGTSLAQTADEINKLGGVAKPILCDHGKDEDVENVFKKIFADEGKLDILVNNVFNVPDGRWTTPFWEQKVGYWDPTFSVGVRCHYLAGCLAAEDMVKKKKGLIINISSFGATNYLYNVAYGAGKAAVDKMSFDMGADTKNHGVCVLSLWPGFVKTEYILDKKDSYKRRYKVDVDEVGETPLYTGRAVAALASLSGRSLMRYNAKQVNVGDLARYFGFSDSDGYQYPPTLSIRFALLCGYAIAKGFIIRKKKTT